MLNSICRVIIRSRLSYSSPIVHNVRFSPFSSKASESISEIGNKKYFTPNYLIDTFGFSQEKACSASKFLQMYSTGNVVSVIEFLKNRGFTSDQIGYIVRCNAKIVITKPIRTFAPKIDFFLSLGLSQAEVNKIILTAPFIFTSSLDNVIIPTFSYIKSLFDSNGISFEFKKRLAIVLSCNVKSQLVPNIVTLRDTGVPDSKIITLLQNYPRALMVEKNKFKEVVEEVKQMNINPDKVMFIEAVRVIRSMSKLIWEKKVAFYKNWGLSENDIIEAFQKHPTFMAVSEDKIMKIMNLLVKEMGLDYSFVVRRPITTSYSFEKRIMPRYSVYKYLLNNGLINRAACVSTMFCITEASFLKKFVEPHEKEVPELLKLYQKEL